MKALKAAMERWIHPVHTVGSKLFKRYVLDLNEIFNSMPLRRRKIIAVLFGSVIATLIILLMIHWVFAATPFIAAPGKIIYTEQALLKHELSTQQIIPLGQFISRDTCEDIRLTIAVSTRGEFLIGTKADSTWTPVTTEGLQQLEHDFKFIPVVYDTDK